MLIKVVSINHGYKPSNSDDSREVPNNYKRNEIDNSAVAETAEDRFGNKLITACYN